jgi:transcriptional/translational regulatory protein YebC/TACO1
VAVYGYHTRLFSLAAPKLSCLTRISVRQDFESIRFEAYGPGGAAMIMDCLTDSRGRTKAQLCEVLGRYGGRLGARGSVDYLFNRVGRLLFAPGADVKRVIRLALDAGAEDVVPDPDGSVEVLTDPSEFLEVQAVLRGRGLVPATAKVTERASTSVPLDAQDRTALVKLIEALEDLNDVQNVYTNVEISDEVLARF